MDVHDIKAVHGSNPGLQRYVAGLHMQDFHIEGVHAMSHTHIIMGVVEAL